MTFSMVVSKRLAASVALGLVVCHAQASTRQHAALTPGVVQGVQMSDSVVGQHFDYMLFTISVRDAARRISQDMGVNLVMSEAVRGSVNRLRLSGNRQQVLDLFTNSANLDGYIYAGTLYVSARSESASRLLPLQNMTVAQSTDILQQAGLLFPEFRVHAIPGDGALLMTGPASWIALCIAVLNSSTTASPRRGGVIVRRGTEESIEQPRN